MNKKLNCWEFNNCGREPGGLMTSTLGECPVASAMKFDGTNDGVAAGRSCWMVPKAACKRSGKNGRITTCHTCQFYKRVLFEEADKAHYRFESIEV